MNDEITTIEHWEWIWWDNKRDEVSCYSATGTNLQFMEQRYIQNPYGKQVHSLDGGAIETKWSTRWEDAKSFTTFWKECSICGKKFDTWES